MYTTAQRRRLLELARAQLGYLLSDGPEPELPLEDEALMEPKGAFVTLKRHGMLRGCIGTLTPEKPLAQIILEMAEAAAREDPRFPPVRGIELPELEIEISVLTPFEPVFDTEEIEVGVHGLLMRRGSHSGLLLPQVPTEYGWSREEFLDHTCHKAGLPAGAWRDPETQIWSFSAEVFSEAEVGEED